MKAIILVSSIFYLLGLKISNKTDFVKQKNNDPVVVIKTKTEKKTENSADFTKELAAEDIIDRDSLKTKGLCSKGAPFNKDDA